MIPLGVLAPYAPDDAMPRTSMAAVVASREIAGRSERREPPVQPQPLPGPVIALDHVAPYIAEHAVARTSVVAVVASSEIADHSERREPPAHAIELEEPA